MKLRRKIAALAITAAALGASAGVAEAHSFGAQGPTHTHLTGSEACTAPNGDCYRWILANGAIIQGNGAGLVGQYDYVLVWCSYQHTTGSWFLNTQPWGPYNNTGAHTYCQNPKYSGEQWSIRP